MVVTALARYLCTVHIPLKCRFCGLCNIFGGVYVLMGERPMFVVGWCSVVQAVWLVVVCIVLVG
jgi:hypothetical protein